MRIFLAMLLIAAPAAAETDPAPKIGQPGLLGLGPGGWGGWGGVVSWGRISSTSAYSESRLGGIPIPFKEETTGGGVPERSLCRS